LAVRSVIQIHVSNTFRIGVLGSGKGSNFVAIADAVTSGKIPAEIAIVLSDVEDAGILAHARERKLPAQFIAPGKFRTKLDEEAEGAFVAALQLARVDLVVLAGFMRVLTAEFVNRYYGKLINIHPSLLPAFPGLHTHRQALASGVRIHGCSVHFVTPQLDHGPIIAQAAVAVHNNDTEDSLAARVLQQEHQIYPQVLRWLCADRVSINAQGGVDIANASAPHGALQSPAIAQIN